MLVPLHFENDSRYFESLALFGAWLANPVFWVGLGCVCRGRYIGTGLGGIAALIIGLLCMREAFLIGYYFWVCSFALLVLAAMVGLFEDKTVKPRTPASNLSFEYDAGM
jgi:hypothetical protein